VRLLRTYRYLLLGFADPDLDPYDKITEKEQLLSRCFFYLSLSQVEGLEVVQAKAGLKFNVRPDSGPLMELQQHMLFNEQQIMGEALEGLAIQVGSVQVQILHLFVRQKFFQILDP
jgi:hypothetical protein